MQRIYLDHAATTPLDSRVLEEMKPFFSKKFGNASSLHFFGREAKIAVEDAREKIAKLIGATAEEIFFTSCGTESDNIALQGTMNALRKEKSELIVSAIEHPAVLETALKMQKNGFIPKIAPVKKDGLIELNELQKLISERTGLVSVMHANNEIGTIQPLKEISDLCGKKNVLFHSDAVQSAGKIKLNVKNIGLDLLSASAHKFYGPKGSGLLYVKKGIRIEAIGFGGGHEKGLRSGTENIPAIVGMRKALELSVKEMPKREARILKLRKKLVKGVLNEIDDCWLNGSENKRIYGNANFSFKFIEGESLVYSLDEKGIATSTGSACSTKSLKPSHVLLAIGLSPEDAHGSLRLTLGKDNTEKEINYLLKALPPIVERLRKFSPLKK